MPLYVTRFSYTPETWARLIVNPEGPSRGRSVVHRVGGWEAPRVLVRVRTTSTNLATSGELTTTIVEVERETAGAGPSASHRTVLEVVDGKVGSKHSTNTRGL